MAAHTIVFLALAGIAGGIVNAIAGGATLITFPAMLYAGLPPIIANASNAVAILPGHLFAAIADRRRLPPLDGRTKIFLAVSALGGAVGAIILLIMPEKDFILPTPALIAFATLLFAFAPRIQARSAAKRGDQPRSKWHGATELSIASIYGGFFGAGLGVILTAVLSITETTDIRGIKALKNLLATGVSIAATAIFIEQGAVRWSETLIMLVGAMLGGYAGGFLIRVLPGEWVRRAVISAGCVMFVIYAGRYWF